MQDRYTGKKGELNFEEDLVNLLIESGWKDGVLTNKTVRQHGVYDINNITSLEGNFRKVLFENNRKELNNEPLSDGEFSQIMEKIDSANTPIKAHALINGGSVSVKRDDNSKDIEHAGNIVHITIFNRKQIASGDSKYQIARQTVYETGSYTNDRRGDVTLLINGLPVIHLELKARNVAISEACNQIVKYAKEGVFTGLMGLVQVFFALNPEEVVYFANFGDYKNYNDVFVFHWADEGNEVINNWQRIIRPSKNAMLSIPEAHQLIGYYTVADKRKSVLRVMRSYQYYAVKAICSRVSKQEWGTVAPLGGINWHTTGSGKTLSAFKTGEIICDLKLADKVVFVVDRVELNSQSLEDYNSFSLDGNVVQGTTSATDLFHKLKSANSSDCLMITSIQKMHEIEIDSSNKEDIKIIQSKRIVFIVDEAQRSQFGVMHEKAKNTFPTALFFGFTGTPIMGETEDDTHDTRNLFGDYISVYTIANGIQDGNVLGFNPMAVTTYQDRDLREAVALHECKAKDIKEVKSDTVKYKIYREFINNKPMQSNYIDKDGNKQKGIEGYLPSGQYDNDEHRKAVVEYILKNWDVYAIGEKGTRFHALLATSSIAEAIKYYRLFKSLDCDLNVTALFDGHIGNNGVSALDKEKGIEEILVDYNTKYETSFNRKTDPDLKDFKKDIMERLAHKNAYAHIGSDKNKDKVIDILIVVNQLLTGYDSQYINTLYLDDVIEASNLIQAISRTNRVYDVEEKPFGIFRFFRKVHTMKENLNEALRLYCEGDSVGVVVATVEEQLAAMNEIFATIERLFNRSNIKSFNRLPKLDVDCQEFRNLFVKLRRTLNAVRLQGGLVVKKVSDIEIYWDKTSESGQKLNFDSDTYNVLFIRYCDLVHRAVTQSNKSGVGFNIDISISEIEMANININYLETHFKLIVPKLITVNETEDNKEVVLNEFYDDFGKLSERQKKYAKLVLADIKSGVLKVEDSKQFIDYISDYSLKARKDAIHTIADRYGINEGILESIIVSRPTENTLNEGMRFTKLCDSSCKEKIEQYYGLSSGRSRLNMHNDLKRFILEDIENI